MWECRNFYGPHVTVYAFTPPPPKKGVEFDETRKYSAKLHALLSLKIPSKRYNIYATKGCELMHSLECSMSFTERILQETRLTDKMSVDILFPRILYESTEPIQGVSGRIVNILGGGSMDYSE